jgi:predicted Fe-Mo cluster-binding NifX family protein
MKVVIPCRGETLEDRTAQFLGRCPTFLLVDTDTNDIEAMSNEASSQTVNTSIGAARQLTHHEGVEAVITGQMGLKAARILEAAGISVYVGAKGTVREALKAYRAGRLLKRSAKARGRIRRMRLRRGRSMVQKHGSSASTPVGKKHEASRHLSRDGPETDLSGVPPTSGFHAGAEPSLPDEDKEDD